jgi:AcrR family transcriptional regulator
VPEVRARQRFEGAAGSVVCDTRHLPIVVVRWFGSLERGIVAAFGQWVDALLDTLEREQLRAAMVIDISGSDTPDPEVRRELVSLRVSRIARLRARFVADFVVIDRPALRAAITAMQWIAPQIQATPVASLDEALRRCHEALAREGIAASRLTAIDFAT